MMIIAFQNQFAALPLIVMLSLFDLTIFLIENILFCSPMVMAVTGQVRAAFPQPQRLETARPPHE